MLPRAQQQQNKITVIKKPEEQNVIMPQDLLK